MLPVLIPQLLSRRASNSADVLLGAGANKIFLNATFDNFVSFKESFDAWCKEGKYVVAVSRSNKNPFSADSKDYEFLRIAEKLSLIIVFMAVLLGSMELESALTRAIIALIVKCLFHSCFVKNRHCNTK